MARNPRRLHLAEDDGYHVISRGHNRETLFADDQAFEHFTGAPRPLSQKPGYRLYHYSLMTNHFYLLLKLHDSVGGCRRSWPAC
jgi:putative transposase